MAVTLLRGVIRLVSVTHRPARRLSLIHICTILGVSNISFGLPCRPYLNTTFLTMAMYAGLDLAIMNPSSEDMMAAVYAYNEMCIRDSIDALCRIADNLTSNLQKYADPAQPVCFEVTAEDDRFCVCLSNAVCTTPQGDSHGVGLKNVAALMERMHGQSSYTIESRTFCITLHFFR